MAGLRESNCVGDITKATGIVSKLTIQHKDAEFLERDWLLSSVEDSARQIS